MNEHSNCGSELSVVNLTVPSQSGKAEAVIYLLYGQDEFSLRETLSSLKEDVGSAELRDLNITSLDGSQVSFDELAATCNTVPFLADKRLVIVEGLLSRFESRAPSRGRARAVSTK